MTAPFRQKKSMSQVFLHTDWPCVKMCDLLREQGVDHVLEIGPGKGILTRRLVEAGFHVTAVEKDAQLALYMTSVAHRYATEGPGSLTVREEDILRFDVREWVENTPGKKAICGNIPYHISSLILFHVLPELSKLQGVFLLVQLEFAKRLGSPANDKSYGSLSVYTQLRARAKVEFKVERSCFYPIPKVDSAVVSLFPRLDPVAPELLNQVEQITRQVFQQRRKKLSNSLGFFLEQGKPLPENFDVSRRCDSLSPQDFLELAKVFFG